MKKQKIKALVLANGVIEDYGRLKQILKEKYGFDHKWLVVAVDAGAIHCLNLKLTPDLIIGDMDSITKGIIQRLNLSSREIQFITSNAEKDESDTQLALDHLAREGFEKIIIVGALGKRMDHSFANLILLASPEYQKLEIKIINEDSEIFTAGKTTGGKATTILGEAGKKISLFSLTPFTYFEKTTGLKYRLKKEKLVFSPARGLSNIFTKNKANIVISEGTLLVIKEI